MEQSGIDIAFSPQIVRRQRKEGKNIEIVFDLLPGYVFAYSTQPAKGLSQLKVEGVIKVLGSPENGYCLRDGDLFFALKLLERNGLIDVLNVLHAGDTVMITDDIFQDVKEELLRLIIGNKEQKCCLILPEHLGIAGLLAISLYRLFNRILDGGSSCLLHYWLVSFI